MFFNLNTTRITDEKTNFINPFTQKEQICYADNDLDAGQLNDIRQYLSALGATHSDDEIFVVIPMSDLRVLTLGAPGLLIDSNMSSCTVEIEDNDAGNDHQKVTEEEAEILINLCKLGSLAVVANSGDVAVLEQQTSQAAKSRWPSQTVVESADDLRAFLISQRH